MAFDDLVAAIASLPRQHVLVSADAPQPLSPETIAALELTYGSGPPPAIASLLATWGGLELEARPEIWPETDVYALAGARIALTSIMERRLITIGSAELAARWDRPDIVAALREAQAFPVFGFAGGSHLVVAWRGACGRLTYDADRDPPVTIEEHDDEATAIAALVHAIEQLRDMAALAAASTEALVERALGEGDAAEQALAVLTFLRAPSEVAPHLPRLLVHVAGDWRASMLLSVCDRMDVDDAAPLLLTAFRATGEPDFVYAIGAHDAERPEMMAGLGELLQTDDDRVFLDGVRVVAKLPQALVDARLLEPIQRAWAQRRYEDVFSQATLVAVLAAHLSTGELAALLEEHLAALPDATVSTFLQSLPREVLTRDAIRAVIWARAQQLEAMWLGPLAAILRAFGAGDPRLDALGEEASAQRVRALQEALRPAEHAGEGWDEDADDLSEGELDEIDLESPVVPERAASELFGIAGVSSDHEAALSLEDVETALIDGDRAIVVDWRAVLVDELAGMKRRLAAIGVAIEVEDPAEDGCSATVCRGDATVRVKYRPSDHDDFDDVVRALSSLFEGSAALVRFRSSIRSDTAVYGVMTSAAWSALRSRFPRLMEALFVS